TGYARSSCAWATSSIFRSAARVPSTPSNWIAPTVQCGAARVIMARTMALRGSAGSKALWVLLGAGAAHCAAAEKAAPTRVIEEDGVRLEYASVVPQADVTFALGQAVYARTVVP